MSCLCWSMATEAALGHEPRALLGLLVQSHDHSVPQWPMQPDQGKADLVQRFIERLGDRQIDFRHANQGLIASMESNCC